MANVSTKEKEAQAAYEEHIRRSAAMARERFDQGYWATHPEIGDDTPDETRIHQIRYSQMPPQDVEDIRFVYEGGYGLPKGGWEVIKEPVFLAERMQSAGWSSTRNWTGVGLSSEAHQHMYPKQLGSPGQ